MFILHVTGRSSVRYTPGRIATYWGRYTEHRGAWMVLRRPGGHLLFREPMNPDGAYGVLNNRTMLKELAAAADVIHCHDDAYPTAVPEFKGSIAVYQAHIGDILTRFFNTRHIKYKDNVRHACITNGYGRLFDKEVRLGKKVWGRLPDIIDIEHPMLRPDDSRGGSRLRISFAFSNRASVGGKINAKDPEAHARLLDPFKGRSEVEYVGGRSFDVAMASKRRAHIVVDELFSPYTHLSSLEGAAVGACVIVNYDDYTRNDLCTYLGAPIESYPFVHATPATIGDRIEYFLSHMDEAIEIGRAARAWMEKYYHPKILLGRYLEFYRS